MEGARERNSEQVMGAKHQREQGGRITSPSPKIKKHKTRNLMRLPSIKLIYLKLLEGMFLITAITVVPSLVRIDTSTPQ